MITNRSAQRGTVVPTLVYQDVGKAIDWLCETFGFSESYRYGPEDHPQGAQLAVGEGSVFLTCPRIGQSPDKWADRAEFRPPRPDEVTHVIAVQVEDVDRHYERARRRGARILNPPETHPFGERQYTVRDPGGHRWTFTQSVSDVASEEWGGRPADPPS